MHFRSRHRLGFIHIVCAVIACTIVVVARVPMFAQAAPDGFVYNVGVDHPGVYRLSASDLRAAGVPIAEIDLRTLKLFATGIEQPLFLADRHDNRIGTGTHPLEYIEFIAQSNGAGDDAESAHGDANGSQRREYR